MTAILPGNCVCLLRSLPGLKPGSTPLPAGLVGTALPPTACLHGRAVVDFGKQIGVIDPRYLAIVAPAYYWRDEAYDMPDDGAVLTVDVVPGAVIGAAVLGRAVYSLEVAADARPDL